MVVVVWVVVVVVVVVVYGPHPCFEHRRRYGMTPLHFAVMNENPRMILFLVR